MSSKRGEPGPSFACVVSAWAAHEVELRGHVLHRLADSAAAEDVVQEVFLKAISRTNALCGIDNPRAWLFQVARNALVDRARTAHPGEPIEHHAEDLVAEQAEARAPVDTLAGCLEEVIHALPPADVEILRACDLDGLRLRDFAATHAVSLPAAKSRLLRARTRLREQLIAACQVRFDADGAICVTAHPFYLAVSRLTSDACIRDHDEIASFMSAIEQSEISHQPARAV